MRNATAWLVRIHTPGQPQPVEMVIRAASESALRGREQAAHPGARVTVRLARRSDALRCQQMLRS